MCSMWACNFMEKCYEMTNEEIVKILNYSIPFLHAGCYFAIL